MKATDIVRRVDDLGRFVIPKEIRRVLKIREEEPLHTTLSEWKFSVFAIPDAVCNLCCRLCRAYKSKAFIAGFHIWMYKEEPQRSKLWLFNRIGARINWYQLKTSQKMIMYSKA